LGASVVFADGAVGLAGVAAEQPTSTIHRTMMALARTRLARNLITKKVLLTGKPHYEASEFIGATGLAIKDSSPP
jgi:hypothetical protein